MVMSLHGNKLSPVPSRLRRIFRHTPLAWLVQLLHSEVLRRSVMSHDRGIIIINLHVQTRLSLLEIRMML